jgi:hypothetical protein
MDGICFLEAVASTKKNSTICEALVTQQSAFIDTVLIPIRLSDVNGFHSNGEMIIHIIIYAGIELSSILVNSVETPGAARGTDKIV